MRLNKILTKELNEQIIKEIKTTFDKYKSELVIKYYKNLSETSSDIDDFYNIIKEDKDLSQLKESNFILENFIKSDNYLKNISLIKDKALANSNTILYPLLYVVIRLRNFQTEEYFDSELLLFYKEVYENYSHLFKIVDFVKEIEIFDVTLSLEVWSKVEFKEILKKIIKKHPKNYFIRERLIAIYSRKEEFQNAINLISETIALMDKENIFNNDDEQLIDSQLKDLYLDIIQVRASIYFSLKDNENAKKDADFILNNLPEPLLVDIEENAEQQPPRVLDNYIETILIRISINLINNNTDELILDKKAITNEWVIVDLLTWQKHYNEAVGYILN